MVLSRRLLPAAATVLAMIVVATKTMVRIPFRRKLVSAFQLRPPTRMRRQRSSSTSSSSLWGTTDDSPSPDPVAAAGSGSGLILPSHPHLILKNIMAPMVAASDYPFRVLLRRYGNVDLTYTQMLHAKNFVDDPSFRRNHLDLFEAGVRYYDNKKEEPLLKPQLDCLGVTEQEDWDGSNTHHRRRPPVDVMKVEDDDAPLMVQLAGHDVDLVVQAAQILYEHTDGRLTGIDLNCGCPQGIARKGQYGAFLMEQDSQRVYDILTALRRHLPSDVAVSCKIRLPIDDATLTDERMPRLLETGISFLTIHGRTLWENKTKVGACHVDRIQKAIETAHKLRPGFPVVANGGMETYQDVQNIVQSTGAAAAMSSEALLETPDLFVPSCLPSAVDLETPEYYRAIFNRQVFFARNYLYICQEVGPPLPGVLGAHTGGSFNVIRGHLFKFLHRYLTEMPDLREALAREFHHKDSIRTLSRAHRWMDELESRYAVLDDEAWMALKSSSPDSSWYRRHRKPDRAVHEREVRGLFSSSAFLRQEQPQTTEERKQEIRARLAKLQEQRQKKTEATLEEAVA